MNDNYMHVIDERQIEMKKEAKQKKYLQEESLREAWTTFDLMLAHGIQLL
jgi:hypothetical protein